ncbi:hypothetical protein [Micromonospora wenchangensis]|uniref:hypothetical protein n=1 Tax=Micromonospora wenchangensis TaxID=1185415 RepID=UPI003D75C919
MEMLTPSGRTLALFDGIGGHQGNLLPTLAALHAQPENALFFDRMFRALDDLREHLGPVPEPAVPAGSRLRRWLTTPATAPPTGTDDSVVAGICVHLIQLCDLQPRRAALDTVTAAIGHSIGFQAAIVAGLRPKRPDAFLALAETSLRLVALSLARGQQATSGRPVPTELTERYAACGDPRQRPGPMALVDGPSRADLAALVDRYRRDTRRPVSVGLVNTPTTGVLSGHTEDLLHFHAHHEALFSGGAATWTFLTNTLPFHSPHLAAAADAVRRDRTFVGPLPAAGELRIPVYAADAPRTLPPDADLLDEFVDQVLVRPVDWAAASVHAVTDAGITTVLDCGPGPAARRFTRECLGGRTLRFESIRRASRRP